MNPLISFVLVNWNTRDLTLQCIKSIYNDCIDIPIEIIVSDNNSHDGSADAIESSYPLVKILKNSTNLGFACGNNVAIEKTAGKFICLINTDVVVQPGCMNTLLRYIELHSKVGLIVPKVYNADGSFQTTVRREVTLQSTFLRIFFIDYLFPLTTIHSHEKTAQVDVASGCFWLIRKETINQVGVLDQSFFFYGEDRDYCKRVRDGGWKIVFHADASIYHYSGSSSKGSPYRYYLLMEKAYLTYWKKHHLKSSLKLYILMRIGYHVMRIISNGAATLITSSKNKKIKTLRSWYSILFHLKKLKPIPGTEMNGIL